MRGVVRFLRRYFIPHEENEYKPHILQQGAILGILFLLFSTFTVVNIQSLVLVSSETLSSAVLPAVLIDLTNENRKDASLGNLTRSQLLDEAARLKAADMAEKGYFAHNSPEGRSPWYWFERIGYEYAYAGENLAVHFSDSDEVVRAWMNSPGHKANIMSANYTEIGIGTARGEYKGAPTIFVVQLFGRPLSSEERAQVAQLSVTKVAQFPVARDGRVEGEATTTVVETAETPLYETTPTTTREVAPPPPEVWSPEPEAPETETTSQDIFAGLGTESGSHKYMETEIATTAAPIASGLVKPLPPREHSTEFEGQSTPLMKLAARPHRVFSLVYALMAILIYGAIALSVFIEWRRQHPIQMLYGAALLLLIWVTYNAHTKLLAGALII